MVRFNGAPIGCRGDARAARPPRRRMFHHSASFTGPLRPMTSSMSVKNLLIALAIGFPAVMALGGCGGDPLGRHAISGTVTFNGAPLEKGNVSFTPTEKSATSSGA